MNLLDKINSALKESALKQEKDKVLTLRMVIAAIKDKEIENKILNDRMNGQNKYGIDATPTIIINEKKYDGDLKYDGLSKEILKLLKWNSKKLK